MQVKTFVAPTMPQALEWVRRELGPDAVLLGTRKVKDPEGKTCVEITAAVDRGTASAPPRAPAPNAPPMQAEDPIVQEQLEDIRGMLSLLLSAKDAFVRLHGQKAVSDLFQHLLLRGLNEKTAFTLLENILAACPKEGPTKSQLLDALSRQLNDRVGLTDPFARLEEEAAEGSPRLYVFLGPTGVGKTTTLAKIAAYLKLKKKVPIGLISLDTYRIGALDQLKTYADILGVPLKVAQTRLELLSAREALKGCSVVLVDTTGRNYLNGSSIQDLQEIFRDVDGVSHFLVLSATAKDEDLRHVIQRFRPLGPESLIFTKIDETLTPGTILNPVLRFAYPLSYLGVGQRVPEDLVRATHKRILGFFFPRGH
uniref:Flagellar biosynthesis protein FlhF n=1 Tax=Desulfacinum infernum TaxID=35837 RepID=A0A832A5N7_9BACT